VNENAILVPQQGVTHNAKGESTALVVTPDNKVELRVIKTDRAIRDKWLVTDGLHVGDRVIVDGLQRARPGAQVVPMETVSTTTAQQQ
jgi:membrane fusion protein (multidrug efflux system)